MMKTLGVDGETRRLRIPRGSPYQARFRMRDATGTFELLAGRQFRWTLYRGRTVIAAVDCTLGTDTISPFAEFAIEGSVTEDLTSTGLSWEIAELFLNGKTPRLTGEVFIAPAAPLVAGEELSTEAEDLFWSPDSESLIVITAGATGRDAAQLAFAEGLIDEPTMAALDARYVELATDAGSAAGEAFLEETTEARDITVAAKGVTLAARDVTLDAQALVLEAGGFVEADRAEVAQNRTATGQDRTATGQDRVQTGLDRFATGADRTQVAADRLLADATIGTITAALDTAIGKTAEAGGYATLASLAQAATAAMALGLFDTTAAGITATAGTTNKYFFLRAAGPSMGQLYKNDAAVAVDQGQALPSLLAMAALLRQKPFGAAGALAVDQYDRVSVQVENDGSLTIAAAAILEAVIKRLAIGSGGLTIGGAAMTAQTVPEYLYAFIDKLDRIAGGLTLDGLLSFADASFLRATIQALTVGTGAFGRNVPPGFRFILADQYGRIGAGLKDTGALAAAYIEDVVSINGAPISAIIGKGSGAAASPPVFNAEINGFIEFGQSRSEGGASVPGITLVQTSDGLMFNGGVRPKDGGGSTAANRSSLVPMVSQTNGSLGETMGPGFNEALKERILADYGIGFAQQSYQMLYASEGLSGTALSGIGVGTTPYNNCLASIDAGAALSQAAGKTYKFRGLAMKHGESDYNVSTPAATWRAGWNAIRAGLDVRAKSYGQSENVVCMMDQVFGHADYGHANDPYLALEQVRMAKEDAGFVMVCPGYQFGAGIHPPPEGQKWEGAYFARAYQRVVIEGGTWSALQPIETLRQGNIVMVRYAPESGELAWDTLYVTARAAMGFGLVDGAGAAIAISSVAIVNKTWVKLVAATAVPAGSKVRYGFGRDGNLRDTMGKSIVASLDGLNRPMHNFALISENTLA